MRILRGQSNLEVSSKGFALFVVGLVLATFLGGAIRTVLSSDQVHRRIVAELKNRFPKQEFQIGQTEVLLSRGIWPGLGLRVRGLTFKQDVCGKLSFVLTIPQATLPLDILSLRTGRARLNDILIEGGELHLDYHDCPPKPVPFGAEASPRSASGQAAGHKSIGAPRLNWQEAAPFLDGISLKNFTVTYEKNPTWKLVFNRAYVALSDQLKGEAQVDIRKSLPFGELSHPLLFNLHGDKSVLQWTFGADFKEGRIMLSGGLDMKTEVASSDLTMRQVPIKDFMSEMFQMGLVDHDLKLKATWLTCSLKWDGHLQNYDENPVKMSACRVEGGYGQLHLARAEFWLNSPEFFKEAAQLKVAQLEIGPIVEALNRQVLPAVLPRLGVWNGDLEINSGEKWRLDGHLQNLEIVFSNQSTHGKQVIDSVHTVVAREMGKIKGRVDEVKVHDGDCAGSIGFDLSENWRDGSFHAEIDNLVLSPVIQKIMVGGMVGPLKIQGSGTLLTGELNQWTGVFGVTEMRGEGWRSENVQVRSHFDRGVFRLDGSIKNATVDTAWRTFDQMRSLRADLPEQVTWRDVTAKVEILKSGGSVQTLGGIEAQNGWPWRAKGSWIRDGEFAGVLNVGQGKKQQAFALHGEKGSLTIQDEVGVSR